MATVLLTGCGGEDKPSWTSAPTNLTWQVYQGVEIPVSDVDGPRSLAQSSVPAGFARTPAGAALAAIGATIRMSLADDQQWPAVGRQLIAPGPERDAWALARARLSFAPVDDVAGRAPKIIAYKITDYSAVTAGIAFYQRQYDKSLTANATRVLWRDGDWRLLLPPHDNTDVKVAAVKEVPADAVKLR